VKRVLVTGGTGVVGAWVVRSFVDRDITPVIFVRGQTNAIGQAINGHLEDKLLWAFGDMLEQASLEDAIRTHAVDAVVHMASAKPWQIEAPFVETPNLSLGMQQIAIGTLNVLEAARRAGIQRVVYASSKAVFDDVKGVYGPPDYRPLPPDYPYDPHMVYGIGKVSAEMLGRYYARTYGTEFVSIRFASSYGPLKRGPTGPSGPEALIKAAVTGQPVRIRRFANGQRDDYVYNKDLGEAFALATLAERPAHTFYNVGAGRGYDHDDFAAAILRVFPKAHVEFNAAAPHHPALAITDRARCVMDNTLATRDFGYHPHYADLADGFTDFLHEERRFG